RARSAPTTRSAWRLRWTQLHVPRTPAGCTWQSGGGGVAISDPHPPRAGRNERSRTKSPARSVPPPPGEGAATATPGLPRKPPRGAFATARRGRLRGGVTYPCQRLRPVRTNRYAPFETLAIRQAEQVNRARWRALLGECAPYQGNPPSHWGP